MEKQISTISGVLIILFFALFAGVIVLLFAQENELGGAKKSIKEDFDKKDDPASWNVYRNEDYEFEIKYPKEYTLEKEDDHGFLINIEGDVSLSLYIGIDDLGYPMRLSRFQRPDQVIEGTDILRYESVNLEENFFDGIDQSFKVNYIVNTIDEMTEALEKEEVVEVYARNPNFCNRKHEYVLSCSGSHDICDEIISTFIFLNLEENNKIKQFLTTEDDFAVDPQNFVIIREDFSKNGKEEVVVITSYPSISKVRIIEKENDEYIIKQEKEMYYEIGFVNVVDFPSNRKSIVFSSNIGSAGTGIGFRTRSLYTFFNEEMKKTWRGSLEFFEAHVSADEHSSYNIENKYTITFEDFDGDGEIDIVQKGEEKEERFNPDTEEWEVEKKSVKNIYKWNEDSREYLIFE